MTVPQDARARRRAETHRRIYRTAMRLFREHGYDEVTVSQIAAASQVSVPTFYDHFASKEHVVLPMPQPAELERVLFATGERLPVAERLRAAIFGWLAGYQAADREELLERWRIVVTTPGLRTRAATFERATAELVLDLVQDDTAPGLPDVVVMASLSAYTQILLHWAEDEGRRPLEDVAAEVLDALRDL